MDLSLELVQKDVQIAEMQDKITRLEEEIVDMEHDMEILADQFYDVNMELANANEHLQEHHDELNAIHALEMQQDELMAQEEEPEEIEGFSSMDYEEASPQPPVGDAHSPVLSFASVGNLDDF